VAGAVAEEKDVPHDTAARHFVCNSDGGYVNLPDAIKSNIPKAQAGIAA
jgi:hypothetical protein